MKHISSLPIALKDYVEVEQEDKAGAFVYFSGEVRNHNEGRKVTKLSYEAKEDMAELIIKDILKEAKEKYGVHYAHCVHRIGEVEMSGCAIVVVTGGSHREETYQANKYIVDRVKYEAPIWKKEYFEDGEITWGKNSTKRPNYLDE